MAEALPVRRLADHFSERFPGALKCLLLAVCRRGLSRPRLLLPESRHIPETMIGHRLAPLGGQRCCCVGVSSRSGSASPSLTPDVSDSSSKPISSSRSPTASWRPAVRAASRSSSPQSSATSFAHSPTQSAMDLRNACSSVPLDAATERLGDLHQLIGVEPLQRATPFSSQSWHSPAISLGIGGRRTNAVPEPGRVIRACEHDGIAGFDAGFLLRQPRPDRPQSGDGRKVRRVIHCASLTVLAVGGAPSWFARHPAWCCSSRRSGSREG